MQIARRLLILVGFLFSIPCAVAVERPWNEDVIYFVITDRFFDGDPENNVPTGCDPALFDKAQKNDVLYHGGDFRGLERALQNGYFKELGVTAIWITPPVRNAWCSPFDSDGKPKAGYHGYWTQDFLDIDPHLVSRTALDGEREYSDSRDGRMEHYRDLVKLAHSQGIKIIQDIVCNHAGPVFFYDTNRNGKLDADRQAEWIPPFKRNGFYGEAQWATIPKWNIDRTAPNEPVTILGKRVPIHGAFGDMDCYSRKGMSPESLGAIGDEEIECDFFSLRDFWTGPSSRFDKLVDDFVETYAFYIETIGVDGFRIDTIKHVHHAFWDTFAERLRRRLSPELARKLILFGEVYDGRPAKLGSYTYRADWPWEKGPSLDSVLNFQFCFAARSYLRTSSGPFGKAAEVGDAFRSLSVEPQAGHNRPVFNPVPGLDGLNSAQKIVNFVENHDGLNRFRVRGVSDRRNLLANALLLTSPGIPCLYYGTEVGLQDARGNIDQNSETGRLTFIPSEKADRLDLLRKDKNFRATAALTRLRREHPALARGTASELWTDADGIATDDGVFVFACSGAELKPVVVAVNVSDSDRNAGTPTNLVKLVSATREPLLAQGDRLQRIPIAGMGGAGSPATLKVHWLDNLPQVTIGIPPESVVVYEVR